MGSFLFSSTFDRLDFYGMLDCDDQNPHLSLGQDKH